MKAVETMKAFLFYISISKEEHDCDLEINIDDTLISDSNIKALNHPRERLNVLSRGIGNQKLDLKDFSILKDALTFSKCTSLDNEIMPDVSNLQKFFMWKFKIKTLKELIKKILKLFKKWKKFK